VADAQRALGVWCFGRLAGTLVDASGGSSFAYEPAWVADGMPPLTIIDIVDWRARRLHELTAPAPSSRARRA
jgi:hypothetical protein